MKKGKPPRRECPHLGLTVVRQAGSSALLGTGLCEQTQWGVPGEMAGGSRPGVQDERPPTTAGGPVCARKESQGQWSEGDTLRDMDGTPEEKCQWPELLCVAKAQGGKPRPLEAEFLVMPSPCCHGNGETASFQACSSQRPQPGCTQASPDLARGLDNCIEHLFFFLETGSHNATQAGLRLTILLPQPLEYGDYRCASSHLRLPSLFQLPRQTFVFPLGMRMILNPSQQLAQLHPVPEAHTAHCAFLSCFVRTIRKESFPSFPTDCSVRRANGFPPLGLHTSQMGRDQ